MSRIEWVIAVWKSDWKTLQNAVWQCHVKNRIKSFTPKTLNLMYLEQNLITIVEKNQENFLNTLLENNIILAVRQRQEQILILSPILTNRQKWKTKSDFGGTLGIPKSKEPL